MNITILSEVINKLDHEYGWHLDEEQKHSYANALVRQVPQDYLMHRAENIVMYYHSNHELVEGLMSEQPDAWKLVQREVSLVASFQFKNYIIDNAVSLEDLIQTGLIEISRSLQGYRYESSFRTWIYGVVIRRLRRFMRDSSASKRTATSISLSTLKEDEEPISSNTSEDLEDAAYAADIIANIARTLNATGDPRLIHIFSKSYIEDKTSSEIGALVGLHESRVRALLKQARDILKADPTIRTWLNEDAGE